MTFDENCTFVYLTKKNYLSLLFCNLTTYIICAETLYVLILLFYELLKYKIKCEVVIIVAIN